MAEGQEDVNKRLKGFLQKDFYVVVAEPVRSPEILKRIDDHLDAQVALEKEGIMLAAGPLYEKGADAPFAGMFVIRAGSFEEAEKIAAADPLNEAGLRNYTVRRWQVNEGTVTLKVDFSDQSGMIY